MKIARTVVRTDDECRSGPCEKRANSEPKVGAPKTTDQTNAQHQDVDGHWPDDHPDPDRHGDCRRGPRLQFSGTRADVRSFCTGEGHFLMEGGNFTLCMTPATDVVCRNDNVCSNSNLELALAEGFQRTDVGVL
jgi:hypothetical protein